MSIFILLIEKEVYFKLAYFNTPIQITDKLDFLHVTTHNFMVPFSIFIEKIWTTVQQTYEIDTQVF